MSIYLTKAIYSQEAIKGLLAKPVNREPAAKAMFDAAGVKLQHMWYSPNGEIICVLEGDVISAATITMVVMASGAFSSVESAELITMGQMVEAMGKAGAVAAKYQAPRK